MNKSTSLFTTARRGLTRAISAGGVAISIGMLAPGTIGAAWAQADSFPTKPITMIVGTSAGSLSDLYMRGLTDIATKQFNNQRFIVENRPGAGATFGADAMARIDKGDGYTLAQTYIPWVRVPHVQAVNFDPFRDVTWIIGNYSTGFAGMVRAESPYQSLKDLVEAAKAKPQVLTFGTIGSVSAGAQIMDMLSQATGAKLTHVPFKGAADSTSALLGGHVDMLVDTFFMNNQVRAGTVRILASFGDARVKSFPNLQTAKEQGYAVSLTSDVGIAGPKNMDDRVVQRIHDGFRKAMEEPAHQALLDKFELTSWYRNSADFTAEMRKASAREKILAERLGWAKK